MSGAGELAARFLRAAAKVLPELAAFAAAVAVIFLDVVVFGFNCAESGIVEWCQFAAVSASGLILLALALRDRENGAGFMLAAALFLDMAIREQDAVLDDIFHGFWALPVGLLTAFALVYAFRRRQAAVSGLEKIASSADFAELVIGLLIILGFSRIIGYKVIWRALGRGEGLHFCKRFVEESTELLGYFLVLVWSLRFLLANRKAKA